MLLGRTCDARSITGDRPVDGTRFDALTHGLGAVADRRTTTRAAVGSALVALGLAVMPDAGARKKPCKKPKVKCGSKCCVAGAVCANGKCAPGCQFTKTATTWTLKGKCTATKTITIPDGVTLDGNGKTIACTGRLSAYDLACLKALDAHDLTLDGSKLAGSCDADFVAGIFFFGGTGEIRNATITNFACGTGVEVFGGTLTISGTTIENVLGGVRLNGGGTVTADDNTITNASAGLDATGNGVSLIATNNTIVGPGLAVPAEAQATIGIYYVDGATGTIDGNTISNYIDIAPGFTSCGIQIAENAGAVTIGTNTFPDPPGNEQNVCDNRE